MIHTHTFSGLALRTGDLLCTVNGKPEILPGEFWRLVGRLVPGEVDHVAVYLGPGGRCAEAGAKGVILFELPAENWDAEGMAAQRGFIDELIGAAYPLESRGFLPVEEEAIRQAVSDFCLAQVGKPYNLNFLAPEKEESFYCSQLAYRAYLEHGIDLNTGLAIESLPGTNRIIYPQEIWSGCVHRRIAG